MLNLLSLIIGLLSWFLAARSFLKRGNIGNTLFSLIFCIFSLVSQFFEINRLVKINDWSAIEDTFPAVLFAAVTLTVVTLILNFAAILRKK